ncbi:MAG: hypothetical protein NT011_11030 [Kiritimatiellaeota bacterium]|nr:hypothetical protein [Kiritimatiellota bacterium]
MIKYSHIILAIWIFAAAVSSGLGESFNDRPTEAEMDELVTLGTESGHGVYERCYATQYSTNLAYYVSPPSFIGMNGWYLSTSVMQALDDKVKALVPYCVDMNTVYDGTANIAMLTVPGVWAELGIGDYVNQFTGTPAIGTNPPTYGDYPWRTYAESLQERYQVLNALKVFRAYRKESVNGSDMHTFGMIWRTDLEGQYWSNTVSGIEVQTYEPYYAANVLGLDNGYEYSIDTNYVQTSTAYRYFYHKMNYEEWQTLMTWEWFVHNFWLDGPPPYTPTPEGYISPTNLSDLGVGGWWAVTKAPYTSAGGPVLAWYWRYQMVCNYATWRFEKSFDNQSLANTVSLYLKPTLPTLATDQVGGESWMMPRQWVSTYEGRFQELSGMSTNLFFRVSETHFATNGNTISVEFGSDEFPAMQAEGTLPSFPDAPTEGAGPYDNTGSIGTIKGSYVELGDYFFLKDWQFNYCTVEY